ncbi:MAG: hypothetical protein RIS20_1933 [Bacteroidota bacterium]|jgi:hypothetical protein
MNNLMQKLTSGHCKLTFFFLFFIVIGSTVFAQSPLSQGNEQNKLQIPFNHHLDLNQLGLHVTDTFDWEIRDSNNEVVVNQSNGNLDAYSFSIPGTYSLSISNIAEKQPSECNHSRLPQSFEITVSNYDVKFDVLNLSFSNSLTTENLQNGLFLDVPVTINMYSNSTQTIDLNAIKVMVQGVGCAISATPAGQDHTLNSGQHNLRFSLKGNSIKQSYIMIDFIDQNGAITTYYHPQTL